MERLTERDAHGNWRIKRFTEILPAHWQACNRLAAIEDILGEEYDLARLRELAQADKECISPCTFCRFNPPSSGDGKPCCMCPAVAALRREQE